MARLGGLLPPFLRTFQPGGTSTAEGVTAILVDDMPDCTIGSDTVSAEVAATTIDVVVAGTITQDTLSAVIDGIGDVLDDFLLDEAAAPVVSRAPTAHVMVQDFGVGGDTRELERPGIAPDGGTSIRNPNSPLAGSFGSVLQGAAALDVGGLTEFTLVFWYRSIAGGLGKVRSIAGRSGQYGAGSDGTNQLAFALITNTGTTTLHSTGTWFDNTYLGVDQMFACVYDGAEMRVYRDAVLDGTQAKTGVVDAGGSLSSLTNDIVAFGAQNYMFGELDRVVLFGKVLSEDDLEALLAGQRTFNFGEITVEVDV